MLPFYLLFIGLFLIFLEFFLPGIILGALGVVAFAASWFYFLENNESLLSNLLFVAGSLLLLVFTVKFAIYSIPRFRGKRGIYLSGDQAGYVASSFDKELIGQEGIVVTDLKPGGYILVKGKGHQAISVSGYLEKGTPIMVLSGEGENLMVRQLKDLT